MPDPLWTKFLQLKGNTKKTLNVEFCLFFDEWLELLEKFPYSEYRLVMIDPKGKFERTNLIGETKNLYRQKYQKYPKHHLAQKYRQQKHMAGKRGIEFNLSFQEWLTIWEDSGHLANRGPRRGQYVMARKGDIGAYTVGNVEIILSSQNNDDRARNKGWTCYSDLIGAL